MTSESSVLSSKLTIDDVKRHAQEVRDMAVDEAQSVVEEVRSRGVIIGVVAITIAVSVAFYLGTRAAARAYDD